MANAPTVRGASTRDQILAVARQMFAEVGYAAASTGEIARIAGVGTRGALYHHFADKPALFAAVFEQAQNELVARHVDTAIAAPASAFEQLSRMAKSFLGSSLEADMRQIVLIDGPAVLGWERFREIGAAYGLGVIKDRIVEGIRDGSVRALPADALAHLVLVSIEEAALYVGSARDTGAAREQAVVALEAILDGIRSR